MTIRTVGRLLGVQFNDEPTDEQGALGLVIDLDGYDEGSSYGADPQRAPLPGSDAPEHHPNAPLSGSESTQQRPGPPDAA